MEEKNLRIMYRSEVTRIFVAVDGVDYSEVKPAGLHGNHEDHVTAVKVIPGVSKIKLKAVYDKITDHYYWGYSVDENEVVSAGDGVGVNACEFLVPEALTDDTTLYIEEKIENEESIEDEELSCDTRDFYFKNDDGILHMDRERIVLLNESRD